MPISRIRRLEARPLGSSLIDPQFLGMGIGGTTLHIGALGRRDRVSARRRRRGETAKGGAAVMPAWSCPLMDRWSFSGAGCVLQRFEPYGPCSGGEGKIEDVGLSLFLGWNA